LSIVGVIAYFIYRAYVPSDSPARPDIKDLMFIVVLQALINQPHFMASYRILYGSKQKINAHRWSSIYLPALMIAVAVMAALTRDMDSIIMPGVDQVKWFNQDIFMILFALSAVYLAWHYTGQSWGMTASFMAIGGARMKPPERFMIRSGYRVMLVIHVSLWASYLPLPEGHPWLRWYYDFMANLHVTLWIGAGITFVMGIMGFRSIARRTGQRIPARAVIPWIATYGWYLLMYKHPESGPIIQLFHALQYLIFPFRVEINRGARKSGKKLSSTLRVGVLYTSLIAAGLMVFSVPEWAGYAEFAEIVGSIVNIHHYFVDGCIWKISNPEVRQDLFGHLKPA